MLRVLLVAEGNAQRAVALAEHLERHTPDARICGVIYLVPTRSGARRFRVRDGLRSCGRAAGRCLLGFIHGGWPRRPKTEGSAEEILLRTCSQAGRDILLTSNITDTKVSKWAQRTDPDVIIGLGLSLVPIKLSAVPKVAMLWARTQLVDSIGGKNSQPPRSVSNLRPTQIEITQITSGVKDLITKFNLNPQPLDTSVSMELKSQLILRDLLVRSVAVIAKYPRENPAERINEWVRHMLPSYLGPAGDPALDDVRDSVPPPRLRSVSKLCVYSLLLLSPTVLWRNWSRRLRRRHPVLILNSHLISDREHRMSLSTEAFYHQVEFFKRYYRIVKLSDAFHLLKSGNVREPTLVLTFDDGYEDNFVNLRAVCEETGVPVALFVSMDPVTQRREFTHDYERGIKGFRALTWDQIRYWAADGTEFQSHTCSHFDCGSVDREALEKEMVESKRDLEGQLGRPVESFAFPFGKPKNMSAVAMSIASKTYDHFFSSYGGENLPSDSESHKHLFRKHLQGNAWESELELQDIFSVAAAFKRFIRIVPRSSGVRELIRSDGNR